MRLCELTSLTMDLPDNIAFDHRVQTSSIWLGMYDSQLGEMHYYHVVLIWTSLGKLRLV